MALGSLIGRVTMRGRMMMLITAAMLPLGGFIGASVVTSYGDTLARARSDVLQTAAFAAGRQAQMFTASRAVLDTLRRSSAVSIGGPGCEQLLANIKDVNDQFLSLGVTDATGTIVCHDTLRKRQAFTDPSLIERVMADDAPNFIVGNFMIGKVTGKPTVAVAAPMRDTLGVKNGMVFASLDLDRLATTAASSSIGGRRSVAVIQPATGRVLTYYPRSPIAPGAVFDGDPLIAAMRAAPAGGVTEGPDFFGALRIFGFSPIEGAETAGLMLAIGEDRDFLLAPVRNHALLSIGLGILAAALALTTAWWLGSVLHLRPVSRLTRAAARIAAGSYAVRTRFAPWEASELRNLATTLNHMAERLAAGREAERAVAASETRYRLLAENTADLVSCVDPEGKRIYASPSSYEMLGRRPEEMIGLRPEAFIHPDDLPAFGEMMTALRAGEVVRGAQFRCTHADGRYLWVEINGRLAEGGNIVFAIRDVTARRAIEESLADANRRLASLASTDALTGLSNRRAFDEALDVACAHACDGAGDISLLMIDVDRFKSFNDRYGHTAGDDCLRRVAAEFRRILQRPGVSVARYGGEEFAVVLRDTSLSMAIEAAEALRRAVHGLGIEHAASEHGTVTISVGIAAVAGGLGSVEPGELVRRADRALYAAKAGGRDRTEIGIATVSMAS